MSEFGDLLTAIRKRRGLTQQQLATESGVSVSLIRQLEQGHAERTSADNARRLAVALQVSTSELLSRDNDTQAEPYTVEEWTTVRRALEGRSVSPPPDEAPTYDGLVTRLEGIKPLARQARFTEMRADLPTLIRDADILVRESDGFAKIDARRLRSRVRHITAWLMTQTWQLEAADLATRLALDDAPDVLTASPVIVFECWGHIRRGDFKTAREVAAKWADDIEPIRISRASGDDLAAWGLVLLKVAASAARDNHPGEADDALWLARMAAMGLRRSRPDSTNLGFMHAFGPIQVSMLQAECAMVTDKPDVTLATAAQLGNRRHPIPWVWNRHRLDVANAHVALKQHTKAVNVLQEIRQDTPEWLTTQRYAKQILGDVIAKRRTLTPEIRDLADFIGVPY